VSRENQFRDGAPPEKPSIFDFGWNDVLTYYIIYVYNIIIASIINKKMQKCFIYGHYLMAAHPDFSRISDDPLYNSRLINNYVEYLKKAHPEVDIDSVLDYAGISTHEVQDQGHWFTQNQVDRFHDILIRKTGDPNISRKVGRFATTSRASGALRQYALGFITPASAYWMAAKMSSNLSRASSFRTRQIAGNQVEVTVEMKQGVNEKPYQCENRRGMLESLAELFTNKMARVEHPACVHENGDFCRYIITWEKTSSLMWKRVRNFGILLGIPAIAALFFLIPPVQWSFLTLKIALLIMIFWFYSEHLEKKALTKAVETQGDAAKDLLEEMNIRYNNALLVQEIGKATSTILHIDKLIATVVGVMERRLDFDRGMIMLTNEENTRLVYTAGYGYSKDQEKLLRKTEFRLDNPESKGLFVLANKGQKPFFVNDISEIEKNFSQRSLELAKKMNVFSLVCVPLVYEKESIGILAADNIKSKRSLTQSDMNLLIGVASQTAVSIANAAAFQKIQESEKKYRELVENANSIILRRNIEGDITFFNEYAQRFFGYGEDEILGENVKGTIFPDTELTEQSLNSLVNCLRQDPETQLVTEAENVLRNGDKVLIAWTYIPIFDSDGDFAEILCIGNDITKLRRTEREKDDLGAQLQRAQKMEAVGTLAGGIAHDFNNILQAISSYAQILLMKNDPDHPDYAKFEAINRSVQRASDLTKRMLIFSRKVKSKLRPMDVNQEVVQVFKMLERTIPKMISIESRLAGNLKTVNADPVQIEQIMLNLGINARDAMPDGGKLTFETKNVVLDREFCKIHLEAGPGGYILLTVSDTGHGMEREVMDRIFEPFFTTKETGKGTGLGLSMVYGIVKSHGGFITCESEVDRGTTFRVYLPVMEQKAEVAEEKKEEIPVKGGTETVLLVDDEEAILKPSKEVLTSFGYTVLTAMDGESALDAYSRQGRNIDLIILDLNMPGMGGRRCLEKFLEMDPGIKVVIATGEPVDGPTKQVIKKNTRAFINKPYDVREMLATVRDVLEA